NDCRDVPVGRGPDSLRARGGGQGPVPCRPDYVIADPSCHRNVQRPKGSSCNLCFPSEYMCPKSWTRGQLAHFISWFVQLVTPAQYDPPLRIERSTMLVGNPIYTAVE